MLQTLVELPDEAEMNTCVVHITEEMGVEDVMDKVEVYVDSFVNSLMT